MKTIIVSIILIIMIISLYIITNPIKALQKLDLYLIIPKSDIISTDTLYTYSCGNDVDSIYISDKKLLIKIKFK